MNLNKEIYCFIENNSSIKFDKLLFDHETYEEPPLIHRYSEVKPFEKYFKKENINTFSFNLAFNYINNVRLYANHYLNKDELSNFFICMTYTDNDSWVDDEGFFIPNFFVTRKENKFNFRNSIRKMKKINMKKYPVIKNTLLDLGLYGTIDVYQEKWFDLSCQDYIQRFYFLNNEYDVNL
ncbi:hypothetical protein BKK56_07130 [Rodentibacter genomosp. 2]|uniref:Imm15 family immunity protein n=1 Tax=Rodentibacter genomosp. 2 TaxID=1908266 RepID=UPI000984DFAB|nr:hypothetical protein BKK56_07130 [Rodentibacter genomosp. 2]